MIIVRPYIDTDAAAIQAMHAAMKFDYEAPEWGKMLVSAVDEVDGKPVMAAFLRNTAETYMLVDSEMGSKKERLGHLLMLHRELIQSARRKGIEDIHCWLPPEIDKNFGKLLMHLGWTKPLWPCYSRRVK